MNGHTIWIWLLVGMIPYHIAWRWVKNRRTLEVRALYWSLTLCKQSKHYQWIVRIPLIEGLHK